VSSWHLPRIRACTQVYSLTQLYTYTTMHASTLTIHAALTNHVHISSPHSLLTSPVHISINEHISLTTPHSLLTRQVHISSNVPHSLWQFTLKMLHPLNPPNRETQISRYLVVQIEIEIVVLSEFVPQNMRFWI